jgi:two-component system sensor histidine kinase UhpB
MPGRRPSTSRSGRSRLGLAFWLLVDPWAICVAFGVAVGVLAENELLGCVAAAASLLGISWWRNARPPLRWPSLPLSADQDRLTLLAMSSEAAAGKDLAVSPASDSPAGPSSGRTSLFWRVFAANALVLVATIAVLAFTPATIHDPIRPAEAVVLVSLLALTLLLSFFLMRHALAPLSQLAKLIRTINPQQPGRRADGFTSAVSEVSTLATAFNGMLDRLESERHDSARRALEAQEAERLRVARELHDEIGQTLTAVALRAERASEEHPPPPAALREIGEAVQRSLDDLRRISRELRPEALDDLGLINALIALCLRVEVQADLIVERDFRGHPEGLDADTELAVYRVAQEALTNVLRHSGARRARVSLHSDPALVTLTVSDDGNGFQPGFVEHGGLAGMRERALSAGGALAVDPGALGGAEVRLRVPVRSR